MSSGDGIWPWGECAHYMEGPNRGWCGCGEWCTPLADAARDTLRPDDVYWSLCRCCRKPLYQLRIAELEAELASFRKCSLPGDNCPVDDCRVRYEMDGAALRTEYSRTVYHKEDE
jgi:hypothetical protein